MIRQLLIFIGIIQFFVVSRHVSPVQFSIIEENDEVVVEIDKKNEKRMYLQISDDKSPFFMFITPCGASVHWQLFTPVDDISISEEFNTVTDLSKPLEQSEKFRLIAGEEDVKRMSFFTHNTPKKLLLVLSPSHSTSPSSTRIFFSPSLFRVEDQYPSLPHDTRLATTIEHHKDEAEARITWKIAAQVRNGEANRYRICAIVSRNEARYAGVCDHVEDGVEVIKCVPQNNNSVLIQNLRRDKQYYITVFVRDHKRGTSSSYDTQMIQTIPAKRIRGITRRQKKQAPKIMMNSKLQAIELEPKKGFFVNNRFVVTNSNETQTAMLIVHACDGLVRINIFRNGRLLKRSEAFSGFRRFVVTNVRNGHLRFQIVNDDDMVKTVRVWASTDLATSPYPILPDDTSVKIVGRTCSTASIQWLRAVDTNVRYCVYRRRENSNFLEQLVSLADNLCEGGLSSSTLVGCYTQNSPSASLIETTVSGLSSASTYRFDLLATPIDRPSAQALPYRTVWVRTNASC